MTERNFKKKFILAPSSSIPYGTQTFSAPNNLVNLGDFTSFTESGSVDVLRWGYNAGAWFGPEGQIMYGFDPQDAESLDVGGTNYALPQCAFSIGRFMESGPNAANWVAAEVDAIFGGGTTPLAQWQDSTSLLPLGEKLAAPNRDNTSMTDRLATKQEFWIATSQGPVNTTSAANTRYPRWWRNANEWTLMLEKFFIDKTYYDLSFTMNLPYPLKNMERDVVGTAHLREEFVRIKPSYNFYVKQYEDGITAYDSGSTATDPDLPSYMLPNIYIFASELHPEFLDPTRDGAGSAILNPHAHRFWKHITLNDRIPSTFIDIPEEDRFGTTTKRGERDRGQHFQKFGKAINIQSPTTGYFDLNEFDEYKNLIFPRSNLDLLKDQEGKERLFPMHVEVEFTTDINTRVSDGLRDTKLTSLLIKWLVDHMGTSETYFEDWAQFNFPDWCRQSTPDCEPRERMERNFRNPRVWDFGEWLDALLANPSAAHQGSLIDSSFANGVFLGEITSEVLAAIDSQYALFILLMTHVFKTTTETFIEERFRPFVNLMRNNLDGDQGGRKFAYSETLLYSIVKTPGNRLDDGTIEWSIEPDDTQRVWFPNSSEIDIVKYIDTQVKYKTPYRYVVNAYQLVIGNKTRYALDGGALRPGSGKRPGESSSELWAKLCLFNTPCLKIIEVPFYDSTWDHQEGVIVEDSPPVPPDVHIIPYQGVDDKLLIWLNGTVGDFEEYPQEILPTDYPEMPEAFWREKIRFKSDDPSDTFEIFKLNKKPESYKDFGAVEPIILERGVQSYVDKKIKPNKKYYYTFRTTDIHGKHSNPTAVYECELVKTDEFIHFLIRTIPIGLLTNFEIVKPFKKFLQVKPAFQQTLLDTVALGSGATQYDNDPDPLDSEGWDDLLNGIKNLGDSLEFTGPEFGVWNTEKKYKIRLHSKKSGRKIDFNVDFDISRVIEVDSED